VVIILLHIVVGYPVVIG